MPSRPLPIATAADLADADLEARAASRRAAREGPLMQTVLRLFADSDGPVDVRAVAAARKEMPAEAVRRGLRALDDDDLLVLRGDLVTLAYPFSAAPTGFVARRARGGDRFICCAIDALGLAPMLGEPVEVAATCHHSGAPLRFVVATDGPAPEAAAFMVWVTRSNPDEARACTGL
jgi:hypothetical protein